LNEYDVAENKSNKFLYPYLREAKCQLYFSRLNIQFLILKYKYFQEQMPIYQRSL